MSWLSAVQTLREQRRPGVLVTITAVRGHAPRDAGAKMVVASDESWGTIGGGHLEATALERARAMLAADAADTTEPTTLTVSLSDKAPSEHGQQCCGGEVVVLLEPLRVVPAVAIFGVGHVGLELARILARHDLELHLIDSRSVALESSRLAVLDDAIARVHVHHSPVPEVALGQVPAGTHVLVMTHDHAEDAALCDAALRCGHLGSISLIGSSAKWARFEVLLRREGHDDTAVGRIHSPIGQRGLTAKDPATIALSVAAELLARVESPSAASRSARPS